MILYLISAALKYKFPDVQNVSTDKLNYLISEGQVKDEKLVIVDTRKEEEFNVSFIPGAKHLEFPSSDIKIKQFLDENIKEKTENIVCYCSVGYRSSVTAQKMTNYLQSYLKLRFTNSAK